MDGLIYLKSRRSTIYGKVTDKITCHQFQKRQVTGRKCLCNMSKRLQ